MFLASHLKIRKEDKDAYWGNENMQDIIGREKLAKKKWDNRKYNLSRQQYKKVKQKSTSHCEGQGGGVYAAV